MCSELRYALGKVLGTHDRLTLRLASLHCVLILTLLKTHTHTHTHTHTLITHLTYNMASFIPKQAYLSIHKAREIQIHKRNSSIHLTCERPYHTPKQGSSP